MPFRPWAAPPEVLSEAGVELGENYPAPVVTLQESQVRTRTKSRWTSTPRSDSPHPRDSTFFVFVQSLRAFTALVLTPTECILTTK